MVIGIVIFGAFLIIVAFLGFFLWQTLFVSEEHGDSPKKTEISQNQQQSSSENTLGTSPAPRAHNQTEEAIARYTKWLAIFTLFLVLATISLFISGERNVEVAGRSADAAKDAAYATGDAVKISRDQLSLAHPPRLRIVDIAVAPEGTKDAPGKFSAGMKLQINAAIVNTGREPAFIERQVCMPYWTDAPLPMHRPYIQSGSDIYYCRPPESIIGSDPNALNPGDVALWKADIVVPKNYSSKTSLYLMGVVIYRDRLSPHRFVLFARRYDIRERRFIAVDNPDYEGQDYE